MTLDELLPTLTAYGVKVWLEGGEVRISVPSRLPERILRTILIPAIRAHYQALRGLLRGEDPAVRGRVTEMCGHPGADAQLMLARRNAGVSSNQCLSCGDALSPGRIYRCTLCARAAWLICLDLLKTVRTKDGEEMR